MGCFPNLVEVARCLQLLHVRLVGRSIEEVGRSRVAIDRADLAEVDLLVHGLVRGRVVLELDAGDVRVRLVVQEPPELLANELLEGELAAGIRISRSELPAGRDADAVVANVLHHVPVPRLQ